MKIEVRIEGNPKVNSSVCHSRRGKQYIPEKERENERSLKASLINRMEYDFKPFSGPVSINKLFFSFLPTFSLTEAERKYISEGGEIIKNLRPDLNECFRDIIKAITGTLIVNDSQICSVKELKKCYSSNPGIVIEVEELK